VVREYGPRYACLLQSEILHAGMPFDITAELGPHGRQDRTKSAKRCLNIPETTYNKPKQPEDIAVLIAVSYSFFVSC